MCVLCEFDCVCKHVLVCVTVCCLCVYAFGRVRMFACVRLCGCVNCVCAHVCVCDVRSVVWWVGCCVLNWLASLLCGCGCVVVVGCVVVRLCVCVGLIGPWVCSSWLVGFGMFHVGLCVVGLGCVSLI